jgi:predicted negative regulator of RcsB-dependent stress response
MSNEQFDEHEQVERVRTWLKNNGSSLITGVALGLAAIAAWQWWQAKGLNHKVEASAQYQAFVEAVEADDAAKAGTLAAALGTQYTDTPHAALAAMRLAALHNAAGKPDEALKALDAMKGRVVDPALSELLQVRAAQVLVGQGKAQDALARLDAIAQPTLPAVVAEVRGDALVILGKRDEARQAYLDALTNLDEAAPTRQIVELKLTDAGGTPPAAPEA